MNKALTTPRKIYSRKDRVIVCYEGRLYASAPGKSKLDADKLAKCEKMKSDGGKARISVVQGDITETLRALPK